jgi:hypothetical protein
MPDSGGVPEHLVVVLPGIGGSVLADPGHPDEPVWSVRLRDVAVLRDPERLSLAQVPVLEPVALVTSLKVTPFWTAIDGYERLLAALGAPDPAVLPVPYDFRLSIAESARRLDGAVRARLWQLWPGGDHTDRVLVVAHSMGGLVARYWIAPGVPAGDRTGAGDRSGIPAGERTGARDRSGVPAGERAGRDRRGPAAAELCRALVTLGTPHRGAPKALEVLANGLRVAGIPVLPELRRVVREWPSVAELLPRYPMVRCAREDPPRYPHELPTPYQPAAAAAFELHQRIEAAWDALPASVRPQVIPRIGYGHATLRSASWDGRQVTVSKEPPAGPDLGRWDADRGDGTVPAVSGLPIDLDRHRPTDLLIRARHGQLGALEEIRSLLDGFAGRPVPRPVRGQEHPPVLGLDIDELQLPGAPVEVAASVHGAGADPAAPVWASVTAAGGGSRSGGGARSDARLVWDADRGAFRGRIAGLPPGVYTVAVVAESMPGVGALRSRETVTVLDDADLA